MELSLDHWAIRAPVPVPSQPSCMTLGKSLRLSESRIASPKQWPLPAAGAAVEFPRLPTRPAFDTP